jgi:hypothetical protein
MTKVMNLLCEKLSLARLQYPLKNGNAQICRYEGKDFSVITMWNRLSAEKGLKQLPDLNGVQNSAFLILMLMFTATEILPLNAVP